MKPPYDADDDRATDTDELVAHVIPLRHREAEPPQPPPTDELEQGQPPSRIHSVWEPSAGEPLPRRRATAPQPSAVPEAHRGLSADRAPRRSIAAAAIAGAASATVAVVLALGVLQSQSGANPRQTGALAATSATPASSAPKHTARPSIPKHTTPASHPRRHRRAPTIHYRRAPETTPAPLAAHYAPASTLAPARAAPSGAAAELGFER
jgi:hypothetical protein